MRNGNYRSTYPRPFRSAHLKSISKFANLGLFSMTFSKNVDFDLAMLNAYRDLELKLLNINLIIFWRYLTLQLISA